MINLIVKKYEEMKKKEEERKDKKLEKEAKRMWKSLINTALIKRYFSIQYDKIAS